MKKLMGIMAIVGCILLCSFAVSFAACDERPPLPDGAYSYWIHFVREFNGPYAIYAKEAKAGNQDVLIDDYCAGRGYNSSKLLVYFDKRTTHPIIVKMSGRETEVMVFKSRSQYECFVPAEIRKKLKIIRSWKDWK